MEFAIAKMSSKGQIVIPSSLREDFRPGEEFLMVKQDGKLVIKKIGDLAESLKDDLKFAESVDDAWKEYEAGQFKSTTKKGFLEELAKW
ncbi:MAG: AbrB/MazE/SpoVT family DNA-binding domain-containing protein [Candidatus Woesearchaeota archaeon]